MSQVSLLLLENLPLSQVLGRARSCSRFEFEPSALPTARATAKTAGEKPDLVDPEQEKGGPCIYVYLDIAAYLGAWITWRRARNKACSAAWFAEQLGGKRTKAYELTVGLSDFQPHQLPSLARLLNLPDDQVPYLEGLVRYKAMKDPQERANERRALIAYAEAHGVRTLAGERFLSLSHWAPLAICSLTFLPVFRNNPAWISFALRGRVLWQSVKGLLESLIAAKMLERRPDGSLRPPPSTSKDTEDERNQAQFALHESVLRLFRTELLFPSAQQHFTGLVLALPESAWPQMRARLDRHKATVERILLASDDPVLSRASDRVELVAFQFLPISCPLTTTLTPKVHRR